MGYDPQEIALFERYLKENKPEMLDSFNRFRVETNGQLRGGPSPGADAATLALPSPADEARARVDQRDYGWGAPEPLEFTQAPLLERVADWMTPKAAPDERLKLGPAARPELAPAYDPRFDWRDPQTGEIRGSMEKKFHDRDVAGIQEDRSPIVRALNVGVNQGANRFISYLGRGAQMAGLPVPDDFSDTLNREAVRYEKVRSEVDPGALSRGLAGSVASLTEMAPTMGMGLAPIIMGSGLSRANQAATEGKDAGLSGGELGSYVTIQGAIEGGVTALFNRFLGGGLESMLAGKQAAGEVVKRGLMPALKRLGVSTLEELPEEITIEIADQITQQLKGVDPTKTLSMDNVKLLAQTALDTAIQTVMTVGLAGSVDAAEGAGQSVKDRWSETPAVRPNEVEEALAGADAVTIGNTEDPAAMGQGQALSGLPEAMDPAVDLPAGSPALPGGALPAKEFITRRDRAVLRDLGYGEEEIVGMDPARAGEILAQGTRSGQPPAAEVLPEPELGPGPVNMLPEPIPAQPLGNTEALAGSANGMQSRGLPLPEGVRSSADRTGLIAEPVKTPEKSAAESSEADMSLAEGTGLPKQAAEDTVEARPPAQQGAPKARRPSTRRLDNMKGQPATRIAKEGGLNAEAYGELDALGVFDGLHPRTKYKLHPKDGGTIGLDDVSEWLAGHPELGQIGEVDAYGRPSRQATIDWLAENLFRPIATDAKARAAEQQAEDDTGRMYAQAALDDAEANGKTMTPEEYISLRAEAEGRGTPLDKEKVNVDDLPDGSEVLIEGEVFTLRTNPDTEKVELKDHVTLDVPVSGELRVDEVRKVAKQEEGDDPFAEEMDPKTESLFYGRQGEVGKQPARADQSDLFGGASLTQAAPGVGTPSINEKIGKSDAPKDVPDMFAGKTQTTTKVKKSILDNLSAEKRAKIEELKRQFREKTSGQQLNVGFDPELFSLTVQIGAGYVEAGVRGFNAWSRAVIGDLGEAFKPYLKAAYLGSKHMPGMDAYRGEMTGDGQVGALTDGQIEAILQGEGQDDVSGAGENLERDRDDAGPADLMGAGGLRDGSGSIDGDAGEAGGADGEGGVSSEGDRGVSGNPADVHGAQGNHEVHPGERGAGPARGATRNNQQRRSGAADDDGTPPDADPGRDIGENPADGPDERGSGERANDVVERDQGRIEAKQSQRDAEKIPIKFNDAKNIEDTLPMLLPEQREDVVKAEKRLFGDEKKGMLFTNATGTGKTYTGLGIIKRMVKAGRKDIIIVVPTDAKAKDWIEDGHNLMLNIQQLEGVKDAGKGVCVTTYANFGQNEALLSRKFDAVVYDESHYLLSNQQGETTKAMRQHFMLTSKPGWWATQAAAERNPEYQRLMQAQETMEAGLLAQGKSKQEAREKSMGKFFPEMRGLEETLEAEAKEAAGHTKAVFLSATPFPYHFALDYADGYLFDYGTEDGAGYNSGDGRARFYMSNFGYRMRYNKLTQPESAVDTGLMERQFFERLRKEGAVSGRALEIEKDYSRDFVLVDSELGSKIDEGIDAIYERDEEGKPLYPHLELAVAKKYNFLYMNQLMENLKARQAVERIKKHLALGRNVVVFHNYIENQVAHPFDFSDVSADPETALDIEQFKADHPDLVALDMKGLKSPVLTLREAFGEKMLEYNGRVPKKQRMESKQRFNDNEDPAKLMVVQIQAGKEGISLHDTLGDAPRVVMTLGLPYRPTDAIQIEGRIYRWGTESNAIMEYPVLQNNFERFAFASKINSRVRTAENLAMGEQARNLEDSFRQAYDEAEEMAPNENQGTGGKAFDRSFEGLSEFDRAKTFYYARQKKTSRTKSAEGKDYFATPEPIGLKMVQWGDARPNDRMLEPSAGHGAIGRFFPGNTTNVFIEPIRTLASELAVRSEGEVKVENFENHHKVNKHEVIAMNPPFGSSGKTAMEHVAKAADHLSNGGRIVAIIPDGPAMGKRFDAWFESDAAKGIYLVASIKLPSVAFERAGTGVNTRIIVLDKHVDGDMASLENFGYDLSDSKTVNELFDRIEHLDLPKRNVPENSQREEASLLAGAGLRVEESETSKGKKVWLVRGDTFKNKDLIKRAGKARFNKPEKAWSFEVDPTSKLAELLAKAKENKTPETNDNGREGQTLYANPFLNPVVIGKALDMADAGLRIPVKALAKRMEVQRKKLPAETRRQLHDLFGEFEDVRQAFESKEEAEMADTRLHNELLRSISNEEMSAEELTVLDRILRGVPEEMSAAEISGKLDAMGQELGAKWRGWAQMMTAKMETLGLPFREEWKDGDKAFYPNFMRQHLSQAIAGRLFGKTGNASKPGKDAMGHTKTRYSDRFSVWDAKTKATMQYKVGKKKRQAIFKTREEAEAFLANAGLVQNYLDRARKQAQPLFPDILRARAFIEEAMKLAPDIMKQDVDATPWFGTEEGRRKLRDLLNRIAPEMNTRQVTAAIDMIDPSRATRGLYILEPMSHEQMVAKGLIEDPRFNLARAGRTVSSLVRRTQFLDRLGKMVLDDGTQVVTETPDGQERIKLADAGFSIPAELAENNPAIQALRDGYVLKSVAEDLASLYGQRGLLRRLFDRSEASMRWSVTIGNPGRYLKQPVENELQLFMWNTSDFADLKARKDFLKDLVRHLRGESVPIIDEALDMGMGQDARHSELAMRSAMEGIGLDQLNESLSQAVIENKVLKGAKKLKDTMEAVYAWEDLAYKLYAYARERGEYGSGRKSSPDKAYEDVANSFFDYSRAPRWVQTVSKITPFRFRVAHQFARIGAHHMMTRPARTMLKVALMAGAWDWVRDWMHEEAGLGDKEIELMGRFAPKWGEVVLPATAGPNHRNLKWSISWLIPFYSELRGAVPDEGQELVNTVMQYTPMVVQAGARVLSGKKWPGRDAIREDEMTRWQQAVEYAKLTGEALPGIYGQYWVQLWDNAHKPPAFQRPYWEWLTRPAAGLGTVDTTGMMRYELDLDKRMNKAQRRRQGLTNSEDGPRPSLPKPQSPRMGA
ncbi:MAG: DEAD/DEAH box helicase family protein [Bryobacteraceae bacterium]